MQCHKIERQTSAISFCGIIIPLKLEAFVKLRKVQAKMSLCNCRKPQWSPELPMWLYALNRVGKEEAGMVGSLCKWLLTSIDSGN